MFSYNIFLTGFMGTGKSTVASCFGDKFGMSIIEMDEAIAKMEGMSISDIFAQKGEGYFRNLETEFLRKMSSETGQIVSCGGGVVLREENVELMRRQGVIILLEASPEEILRRVKEDDNRPLLKDRKNAAAISELLEQRQKKYEDAADIVISTDGNTPEEICEKMRMKIEKMKVR